MVLTRVSPVSGQSLPTWFFRILIRLFSYLHIYCLPLFKPPLSGGRLGDLVGGPRTTQSLNRSPVVSLGNRHPPFRRPLRGSRAPPCLVVDALQAPVKEFLGAQGIHDLLLGSIQGIHTVPGVTTVMAASG